MTSPARLWRLLLAFPIVSGLVRGVGAEQAALSEAAVARAGIAVATLHTARISQSIPALGSVLDPAPLIALSGRIATINAQVAGAKAKVVLEQQQMAQASLLYKRGQIISQADYQKAAEDLAANQALLSVARARRQSLLAQIEASWGPTVAAVLRSGGDPLPQLAAGTAMLVGLSLPPGTTLSVPPSQVEAEAAGIRFPLRLISSVPKMLGGYPGQAFVYKADAQPGIPIGTIVSASLLAGPVRTGVLVPFSAVLWQHGRAVVFRAADGDRFDAVPIVTDIATDTGYLVSKRLVRGNRIVVRGGALLLGATNNSAGETEED